MMFNKNISEIWWLSEWDYFINAWNFLIVNKYQYVEHQVISQIREKWSCKYLSFYCLALALFFTANDTMPVRFSKACWIAQYDIFRLVRHQTKLESRLYAYTCVLEKELTILWPRYVKPLHITITYSRGPMSTSF